MYDMHKDKRVVLDEFSTVFGEDMAFKGDVTSAEDVVIYGTMEGHVACEKTLYLLDGAVVNNEITARNCVLDGADVTGEFKISACLEIRNGSTIRGKVATKVLDVENGACVNAVMKMERADDAEDADK